MFFVIWVSFCSKTMSLVGLNPVAWFSQFSFGSKTWLILSWGPTILLALHWIWWMYNVNLIITHIQNSFSWHSSLLRLRSTNPLKLSPSAWLYPALSLCQTWWILFNLNLSNSNYLLQIWFSLFKLDQCSLISIDLDLFFWYLLPPEGGQGDDVKVGWKISFSVIGVQDQDNVNWTWEIRIIVSWGSWL